MRFIFQVNCHDDVLLEMAFLWKSILAKLILMRLLFQVDCHDVILETAFLWKSVLAKLTLMRLLFQVDCRDVLLETTFLGIPILALGDGLSLKIFLDKFRTHEASLFRWTAVLCFGRWSFHESLSWQIHSATAHHSMHCTLCGEIQDFSPTLSVTLPSSN